MKICTWNVRRAVGNRTDVWGYFEEINPDIALLQELGSIPDNLTSDYSILQRKASADNGNSQKFSTAILVKGKVEKEIELSSSWDWVKKELEIFHGNLVAANVTLVSGENLNLLSVYCPAWPINEERLKEIDVSEVKLENNPKIWLTEILWAALANEDLHTVPWIVSGDLNSSVTFDSCWGSAPRGNQEIQDRMVDLGLVECLAKYNGELVPTFRNPRGGNVTHQMDHCFVSNKLADQLSTCVTGDAARVFDDSLSDHLPIITEFS
jgi:exonuclease III